MTQQELKLPKGWIETRLEDCVDILDVKRVPINSTGTNQKVKIKLIFHDQIFL